MSVHYPKNFIGRCKQAKLVPVTIDIGAGLQYQGGVDTEMQLRLLSMLQECGRLFPASALPPAKVRTIPPASTNGNAASFAAVAGQTTAKPADKQHHQSSKK